MSLSFAVLPQRDGEVFWRRGSVRMIDAGLTRHCGRSETIELGALRLDRFVASLLATAEQTPSAAASQNEKPGAAAGLDVVITETNYLRAQATEMLAALGLQRAVVTPSLT